jgi:hypothetical protein
MVLDPWLGHVCVSSGRRNSLQSIRLGFLLAVVGFLWTRLRYRIRVEIASIMAVVIGRVAGLFGAEARLAARGVGPPADSAVIQVVLAPEVSPVWAGGSEAVTEWVAATGK